MFVETVRIAKSSHCPLQPSLQTACCLCGLLPLRRMECVSSDPSGSNLTDGAWIARRARRSPNSAARSTVKSEAILQVALTPPSTPLNHPRDSLKSPVNLLTTDDEWRCDANHPIVRFLAQDSFLLQSLAVGARRARSSMPIHTPRNC
jgi:hypothetical protein